MYIYPLESMNLETLEELLEHENVVNDMLSHKCLSRYTPRDRINALEAEIERKVSLKRVETRERMEHRRHMEKRNKG